MQNQNPIFKAWQIVSPVCIYYILSNVIMYFLILILKIDQETYTSGYMMLQTVATAFVFPFVFVFYQKDKLLCTVFHQRLSYQFQEMKKQEKWKVACLTILCSSFAGIALNNLLTLTRISELSQGYQQVTTHFFGGSVFFEILGVGILIPIVEEVLYRGVIYGRLSDWMGIKKAAFLSTLIFAVLHFNLVQFIYGFLMGLLLIFFLEKNHSLFGAVLAHIAANLTTVLRVETGCLRWMEKNDIIYMGMTILMLGISMGILWLLHKDDRKVSV